MPGFDADAPSKPFGGAEEFAFTPDGKGVVFSARNVGREEAWSTNFDLFFSPLDGKTAPRQLTTNPAWDTQPVFSPDGKQLVYMKMARPGFEADRFVLVVRDGMDGADRVLTEGWDRSPEEITWSADGKTIYVAAQDVGQKALFAIDAATGAPRAIVGAGTNSSIGLAAGGRLVYAKNHLKSPTELWTAKADGTDEKRITRINDERLAAVKLGEPEQMSFRGAGGDMVFAYIVKPVDFDPAKKYPVAFLIHGGPQGSFGNDFHYRWNPQTYAARGYAAVMVDFHGSTGYGQAFTDAIRGDWGGKPLEDLQKGLDAALAGLSLDGRRARRRPRRLLRRLHGQLDRRRLAGPFQGAGLARRQPRRALRLLRHRGALVPRVGARRHAVGEPGRLRQAQSGRPGEELEDADAGRPRRLDYRVVDTGGIATFTAAQRKGIPSKLLYFPDENHWVLKPQNSILWHDTVLDWLDQWVKGDEEVGLVLDEGGTLVAGRGRSDGSARLRPWKWGAHSPGRSGRRHPLLRRQRAWSRPSVWVEVGATVRRLFGPPQPGAAAASGKLRPLTPTSRMPESQRPTPKSTVTGR